MELLERDGCLRDLDAALAEATGNRGSVALVSGEAGIGKTTLVEHFLAARNSAVRLLQGACDALSTPRPLGPLYDFAPRLPAVAAALGSAVPDRGGLFAATLSEFCARPTIAVVEDVHWADEATLDLLRYLCRRIAQTATLLILTYRDDEIGPRHPLRGLLGDLARSLVVRRLRLLPLSEEAVRRLAGGRTLDAMEFHRRTGGNPFFVTEVLASSGDDVPPTVREAVYARVARLSPAGHAALQAAAVVGPRIEPWLLAAVGAPDAGTVDECLTVGVLMIQGDVLTFRHELARQAVFESISPPHRIALHRRVLDSLSALPRTPAPLARLAHHAAGAGDQAAVLAHAPAAARQAAAASAHHDAATLYGLALHFADSLPLRERAALFSAHAWECHVSRDLDAAIDSQRRAITLWQAAGDQRKQGENLALLARSLGNTGQRSAARQTVEAAIDLLEALPPGRELALAYNSLALLRQYNHDLAEAIALCERAIPLAKQAGDALGLAMAYDTLGLAMMYLDFEQGRQHLEHALEIARQAGLDSRIATAYCNLGSNCCELFRLDYAEQYLTEGLAYTAERDLERSRLYMVGWLAVTYLYRGRWTEATIAAGDVLRSPNAHSNNRWAALIAHGRWQARCGDAAMPRSLDEALALGVSMGDFQLIAPVRVARAEAAWLAGNQAGTRAEAGAIFAAALEKRHAWVAGEAAYWLWRAGEAVTIPDWAAEPFTRQITGDWRAAAAAWALLGCPYEQARALADGGRDAQLAALATFQQLGARPAAADLRRRLRATGGLSVPRGPYSATRTNPFGLTARQMDILALLARGQSNAEIAAQLSIAPKTVDHHVSAVLAKLAVHTREAAAAIARHHQSDGQK